MGNINLKLISIEELCQTLQICKNTAYRLLKSGQLKGFRIGRLWRIPFDEVKQYTEDYSQKKEVDSDEKKKSK